MIASAPAVSLLRSGVSYHIIHLSVTDDVQITDTGNPERPYGVDGDTFVCSI